MSATFPERATRILRYVIKGSSLGLALLAAAFLYWLLNTELANQVVFPIMTALLLLILVITSLFAILY